VSAIAPLAAHAAIGSSPAASVPSVMRRGYGAGVVEPLPRPSSEVLPEVLTVAEAFELAATDPEAIGVLADRPLVAVDLDGASPAEADLVARSLAEVPAVVVGLTHRPQAFAMTPPRFDVLLAGPADPPAGPPWRACPEGLEAGLAAVAAGVTRAPLTATTLVQVLRRGRGASLDAALTIESLAYAMLQAGPEHRTWLAAQRERPRKEPGRDPVGVERQGDTLVVTLQRPEVRNAVDVGTRDGLVSAFDLATRDGSLGRIELRGEGPDFCSGGDLSEFGTLPDPATGHLVRSTRSPARALARCADRTTAYVHGASVGAGIELAALTGRVVATPDATFLLPELGLGLIPGAGGTATLPRRIGPELTAWLALTATPIDAATALRWHLVDTITDTRDRFCL
jgi:enoyl-CoA hydratase/carnithine racemase